MSTVWVTGGAGMLGSAVSHLLGPQARATVRQEVELTSSEAVNAFCAEVRPAWIINCAAYTAVDAAESNVALAEGANRDAVEILAQAAARHGAGLVHVSTDYVFAGDHQSPYVEGDATGPINTYGRTKLAGELALMRQCQGQAIPWYIVRTSWLFAGGERDFVGKMAARLRAGQTLRVVNDQRGRPTYAPDLAQGIWRLCERGAPSGVYHYANRNETSWYGLTRGIAAALKIAHAHIEPISAAEYPTPAARPSYSTLSTHKYESMGLGAPPTWQDALRRCFAGEVDAPAAP